MKLTIAQLQTKVYSDRWTNIDQLRDILDDRKTDGADIVCLPEMFNCPYQTELFPEYAEPEGGLTWEKLSKIARRFGIYLQAGSVPEKDEEGHIYNTAYMFDRDGKQIGKHRKVHLFDIFAHGEVVFKESDTLTAGDSFGVFETEWGKMAMNICFDIRFPESSRIPALDGAKVIFNPGAFNMTTGPAHWELSFRQRAIENQIFMVGTAPARDPGSGYSSWGHSIITDPWGNVVSEMDEKAGVTMTEIDLEMIDKIRGKLPLMDARRSDIYELRQR